MTNIDALIPHALIHTPMVAGDMECVSILNRDRKTVVHFVFIGNTVSRIDIPDRLSPHLDYLLNIVNRYRANTDKLDRVKMPILF